jgi:hypothetical protein
VVLAEAAAGERLAEIEARLDAVMPQLTAATGGASLCMISRSTGPVDGAKYLEGRMAVLSELKRAVRRDPQATLAVVADPTARQWRSDLALQRERGASGGWVAYRAGGVDELEELLSEPGD